MPPRLDNPNSLRDWLDLCLFCRDEGGRRLNPLATAALAPQSIRGELTELVEQAIEARRVRRRRLVRFGRAFRRAQMPLFEEGSDAASV